MPQFSISGKVSDETTTQGIAGVTVVAVDARKSGTESLGSAVTNSTGDYSIQFDFTIKKLSSIQDL